MCVGFWSLDYPDYALILCTNRDEFLSRPTLNAHFHSFGREPETSCDDSLILSGRDLQAGGSWFGINRAGRIALLTNITEPSGSYKSSRGHLVSSFLRSDLDRFPHDLASELATEFAGFNLILFTPTPKKGESLSYNASLVTNYGGGGTITSRSLGDEERHVGGVSNGVDNNEGKKWAKLQKGQASLLEGVLENCCTFSEEELTSSLFELLTWQPAEPPANRSQLRNSIQIPPLRMSASLAADAQADGPDYYGTRLSTVLLVRKDGRVLFVERDIWQLDSDGRPVRGDPRKERVFRFSLSDKEPGVP